MLKPRRIVSFALLFVLTYGVLMGARQWVDRAYASLFCFGGNVAFARFLFWGDGSVSFLDLRSPDLQRQVEDEFRRRVERYVRREHENAARLRYGLGPVPRREIERSIRGKTDEATRKFREQFVAPQIQGVKDTLLLLWNRSTPGSFGNLPTSSRMIGYAPTVVVIALFVATPTTWRRRSLGLLWGLMFIHVFILIRLSLYVAKAGFAVGTKTFALFHPSEFWMDVLTRVEEVVVDNPTAYLAVSVFIWLLICFINGSLSAFRRVLENNGNEVSV